MNPNKTKSKEFAIRIVESVVVILYIVFEELIWNFLAKPIFQSLKSLIALDSLRNTFMQMNRYFLLGNFLLLLAIAEALGLLSGISIIEGNIFTGIVIYTLKVPVAAFTFWLFDLTRDKLLTFQWLKFTYQGIMALIDKIINSSIHVYIKTKVFNARKKLKALIKKYMGDESFFSSIRSHYRYFKDYCRKYL
jgi:hypothetical protein